MELKIVPVGGGLCEVHCLISGKWIPETFHVGFPKHGEAVVRLSQAKAECYIRARMREIGAKSGGQEIAHMTAP